MQLGSLFQYFILYLTSGCVALPKERHMSEKEDFNGLFKRNVGSKILPSSIKPHHNNVLVLNVALGLEDFLLQEDKLLHDIEDHINTAQVHCDIDETSAISLTSTSVKFFCYHVRKSRHGPIIFVPVHKLERLLTSGSMRGFLQTYNVTKFYREDDGISMSSGTLQNTSFVHEYWFSIVVGVASFFLFLIMLFLICMCCRRNKEVEEGVIEGKEVGPPSIPFQTKNKKPSFVASSPIKAQIPSRNSFCVSPKKTFLYSPQKNSTPIFAFTSPQKVLASEKGVYPQSSAMDTASPFPVQPKVNLLFPTPAERRRISGNSSGNSSEKSRSLYQSRMGSSASLIIDLSPKSPTSTYNIFTPHESPTEEILSRKSRLLKFQDLKRLRTCEKELHEEFWSIPPNTVSRKDSQMRFSLKNRYPDILPNSRSIVRMKNPDMTSQYMNANFITGYSGKHQQFIATQGPLACTTADFWCMLWQFDCSIVVMVTKLKEKNKEKCVQYWPSPSTMTQQIYGDVTVTYDSHIERNGYKITTLYASQKGCDESRKITHFWFTAWPDHKVPKQCDQVLSMMADIRHLQSSQHAPVIVHCSAGRGRTGCIIALAIGMNQIDENDEVDILKIVSRIRIERGGLVDKDSQYIFIYQTLYEYWCDKRRSSFSSHLSVSDDVIENRQDGGDESFTLHSLQPKKFQFDSFVFND